MGEDHLLQCCLLLFVLFCLLGLESQTIDHLILFGGFALFFCCFVLDDFQPTVSLLNGVLLFISEAGISADSGGAGPLFSIEGVEASEASADALEGKVEFFWQEGGVGNNDNLSKFGTQIGEGGDKNFQVGGAMRLFFSQ
jgi:hypothetical protein